MIDDTNASMVSAAMDGLGLDTDGYRTILIDPPWPSKSHTGKRTNWLRTNMSPRYHTMTANDLRNLAVGSIARRDSVLVVWATWMHLSLATELIAGWGFDYVTGIPWLKVCKDGLTPIFGPGVWFQHCTELVLIGRRGQPFGKLGNPRPARKGIIIAPRGEHSEKPVELHQWIEEKFPDPKIELFARRKRNGWVTWGDELAA